MHLLGLLRSSKANLQKITLCLVFALTWALGLTLTGYGQKRKTHSPKKVVPTVSLTLSKPTEPFVDEEGRFKIKFPCQPEHEVNVHTPAPFHEYKCTAANLSWRLYYNDLKFAATEEADLKRLYEASIKATASPDTLIRNKHDVYLKGKLGVDYIFEKKDETYQIRAFMVERRLYIISVKEKQRPASALNRLAAEVDEFFASFEFWEDRPAA